MTPEDTIREKSALLADWADGAHPVTVDDVRGDLIAALDALVDERDALAARLAEAEARANNLAPYVKRSQRFEERVAAHPALAEAQRAAKWRAEFRSEANHWVVPDDEWVGLHSAIDAALAAADRPDEGGGMDTTPATHDALMEAWGIIANVSEGDWTKQPQEWQDAAVRWRDETFHPAIRAAADRPEGTTPPETSTKEEA